MQIIKRLLAGISYTIAMVVLLLVILSGIVKAQAPFSGQIQAALRGFAAQVNTWTGTQTFQNITVLGVCTGCGGSAYVNGSGVATGPIQFQDGTQALPAMTFQTEPTLGWYRLAGGFLSLAGPTNTMATFSNTSFELPSNAALNWSSTTNATGSVGSAIIREANDTLAMHRAANQNFWRVYFDNTKYSELTGTGFSRVNGITTVGPGISYQVGTGRSVAQTAAVASVAAYTVGATDASFTVDANVLVTTATTHSFTVTVAYTDEGNTARTATLNFSTVAGVISNAAITNVGGTVPYEGVPIHLRAKAATTITVATVGTFTTVIYNVEANIWQVSL